MSLPKLSARSLRLLSQFYRATNTPTTTPTSSFNLSSSAHRFSSSLSYSSSTSSIVNPSATSATLSRWSSFWNHVTRPSGVRADVSCFRIPDMSTVSSRSLHDASPDPILAFQGLLRNRAAGLAECTGKTFSMLASVGHDSLLLVRGYPRQQYEQVGKLVRSLRRGAGGKNTRRRNPKFFKSMLSSTYTRLNGGASGMLLSAMGGLIAGRGGDEDSYYEALRQKDKGLHCVGIGWIDPMFHRLLGILAFVALCVLWYLCLPSESWCIVSFMLSSLSRTTPDLTSFITWAKEQAPKVAAKKKLALNRMRARIAPYVIEWCNPPKVTDYGIISVATLVDSERYVYLYAGLLNEWILLGWYHQDDRYFTDRIAAWFKGLFAGNMRDMYPQTPGEIRKEANQEMIERNQMLEGTRLSAAELNVENRLTAIAC